MRFHYQWHFYKVKWNPRGVGSSGFIKIKSFLVSFLKVDINLKVSIKVFDRKRVEKWAIN